MITAVNAHFQPMFREGSALATCTQKLRELVAKIQEFFMTILQTILPCVFGKAAPVVPKVVPTAAPQVAQAVVAAALPVVAPLAPVRAEPAVVAAPPAEAPAAAAAAIAQPAEQPAPPAAQPQLVVAAMAPPPAEQPAPPAEQPALVVAANEPPPAVELAAAAAAMAPPPPAIVGLDQPDVPAPDAHELPLDAHHRLHDLAVPRPRAAVRDDEEDGKVAAPEFGQVVANIHHLPHEQRGRAMLAAMRAARRNRPPAAAAAAPAREIRLIAERGLKDENIGAGPFVIVDALHGLWDKILEHPEQISKDDLDGFVRGGIINFTDWKDAVEDEEQVPIQELVASNRDFQIIQTGKAIGPIGTILDGLLAAMGDKKCVGALLVRENETYGVLITSDAIEVHKRFFLVDPYDYISFESFDSPRALAESLLRDRGKGNNFSSIALEKLAGDRDDRGDVGYRRDRSVDLTPAAAAGGARHEELA